jgi:hypothetical protein
MAKVKRFIIWNESSSLLGGLAKAYVPSATRARLNLMPRKNIGRLCQNETSLVLTPSIFYNKPLVAEVFVLLLLTKFDTTCFHFKDYVSSHITKTYSSFYRG